MITKNRPRAAAVYCRVSTDEQAESGTIQNQIEFARHYCDLHDLPIFGVYADDGVSGTVPLQERPSGSNLISDAKSGKFDVALVYRIDRLARRLKLLLDAYEELEVAKVGLRSMTEPIDTTTPIGRFIFQLLGSIAELERETIIERSVLGTNRLAAQGRWLGGIVPYGYSVDEDGYLQVSEKPLPGLEMTEADVVRLIYTMLVKERRSCVQIAEHLNALGVPPAYAKDGRLVGKRKQRTSGLWSPGRVRNMVVQTTYKGVHYYGRRSRKQRRLIERAVPAIVPVEAWETAQRRLRENQIALSPQNAKRSYLLRGLIKCGICGLNYIGCAGSQKQAPYYRCNGKTPHRGRMHGRCPSATVRAEELESLVWNDIHGFVENPGEVLESLRAKLLQGVESQEALKKESQRIEDALAKLQRERDVVIRLLRKEDITYAEGEAHLREIADQVEALEKERQTLFGQLQNVVDIQTKLLSSEVLLNELRESVANADDATKRRLIELLVDEICSVFKHG
jgi:site-specific DNA recombinase